jgi:hypothetical protein
MSNDRSDGNQILQFVIAGAVSFPIAIVVGGFCFGFASCDDCGGNILARMFIGLIFAILTPATLGFPPKNEAGAGQPFNAWPFIILAWLAIFMIITGFLWLRNRKVKRDSAPPIPPPDFST